MYEWRTRSSGDLEFAAKGKIEVLSEHPGEGWWTGIVHGNPTQVLSHPNHGAGVPPSLIYPVFRLGV